MFFVGIIRWWYGDGWRQRARVTGERFMATFDFFSIDLLVKTLFAPFRQISAGHVQGPMAVQLRAFADRLVSRVIGAIVRLIMLVIGVIAIVLQALLAGVILLGWLLVPLLPLVGLMLFIFEVRAPWHL